MKICSKCKVEKPFEAFYKKKASKDGYTPDCKDCRKIREIEFKRSPLMQLEKQIRSSIMLENKLLAKEGKRLCSKCNEIFLINDLIGVYCENCNIEHNKEYYQKNKEKIDKKTKEYKEKNKEKFNEYQKEYQFKNKDKLKKRQRKYRLKKKLEKQNNT